MHTRSACEEKEKAEDVQKISCTGERVILACGLHLASESVDPHHRLSRQYVGFPLSISGIEVM
jgi:hypothetical protein